MVKDSNERLHGGQYGCFVLLDVCGLVGGEGVCVCVCVCVCVARSRDHCSIRQVFKIYNFVNVKKGVISIIKQSLTLSL